MLFAAIAITSPTFVAVGQLLVPPLSMLWDVVASHYVLSALGILGVVTVIGALGIMLAAEAIDERVHPLLQGLCSRQAHSTLSLLPAPGAPSLLPPDSVNSSSLPTEVTITGSLQEVDASVNLGEGTRVSRSEAAAGVGAG